MSTNELFFGWDLLYKTIADHVNKKSDVLMALAHFLLIKRSKFRCIGIGEDKTFSEDDVGSELMPVGWNDYGNKYALRYVYDKQLYLLLGHQSEDCIIVNFMDVKTRKVSNIALEPENLVKGTRGSINDMLPSASEIVERFNKELIEPVFAGTTKEVTTQTVTTETHREDRSDPLRIGRPMRPTGQIDPTGFEPRPFGFPDVGRGDLDPLGRLGSGNLLAFPNRLHLQGQPRFDPFGPPDPNVRPNPNPDHFQPPNFGGFNYHMP